MLFDQRKEWADRYEVWMKENRVKDCAFSVISFLVGEGWEPVIHCKDCMYYEDSLYDVLTNHDMVCAYAPLHHFYREPNDYCSKGERKE